jgi:hypothetical protein
MAEKYQKDFEEATSSFCGGVIFIDKPGRKCKRACGFKQSSIITTPLPP